jgi:hypothetical protein
MNEESERILWARKHADGRSQFRALLSKIAPKLAIGVGYTIENKGLQNTFRIEVAGPEECCPIWCNPETFRRFARICSLETNPESLFFATSRPRSPLFSMSAFAGNGLSGLVSRGGFGAHFGSHQTKSLVEKSSCLKLISDLLT